MLSADGGAVAPRPAKGSVALQFSVVIPLYNKQRYVGRAVDSVLAQTHDQFELIVVDDGSTDGSAEVVRNVGDPRLRLIVQDNGGEAAARNAGIRAAVGSHIAFLDADDRWKPDFLAVMRSLIAAHPGAAIYGTNYEIVDDGSIVPGLDGAGRFVDRDGRLDYASALAHWCFPLTSSSICVPAHMFDAVGMFDERLKLATDTDMWVRLTLAGPAVFDDRPCAVYHKDAIDRSTTQSEFWEKRLFFVDVLRSKLDGQAIRPRDGRLLRQFLSRMTYEALIAGSTSRSPLQTIAAMRARKMGLAYLLRCGAHLVKRALFSVLRRGMAKG